MTANQAKAIQMLYEILSYARDMDESIPYGKSLEYEEFIEKAILDEH